MCGEIEIAGSSTNGTFYLWILRVQLIVSPLDLESITVEDRKLERMPAWVVDGEGACYVQ